MTDILKIIDELVLIKASLELLPTDNPRLKADLQDYIDTLLAEYNNMAQEFEEDMSRSIH
tara:strand:+ start:255 stop:434 length:180 start_codon:yes stop_codon:yes gene_type:complete